MKHEELDMDFFKGTQALMRAADNIIMFERVEVEPERFHTMALYRSQMNALGEWECVKVGYKKRREGPQMFNYNEKAGDFEDWVTLSIGSRGWGTGDLRTGQVSTEICT